MLRNRHFGFLIVMGLLIAALIVILFLLIGHTTPTKPQPGVASYYNNSTAQAALLIDGPVNAVSQHNQVQILVSDSVTTFNVLSGYNGQVASSRHYVMTPAAFHVFLRSLEGAGFMDGSRNSALSQASGYCPLGDRYIFSFSNDGSLMERYWSTSCSSTPHTYNGNLALTLQLFQNQVPNYDNIVSNLNI